MSRARGTSLSSRTWIEIEVDHASDGSVERMNLELTINDRTIFGLLDARGRWRSDETSISLRTGARQGAVNEEASNCEPPS